MANKQLLQSAGDGTAVPAGYVGEVLTSTATASSPGSSQQFNVTSKLIPKGTWMIFGSWTFGGGATSQTQSFGGLSTTSGNGLGTLQFPITFNPSASGLILNSAPFVVNLISDTTYYLAARSDFSGGGNSSSVTGTLTAIRIA